MASRELNDFDEISQLTRLSSGDAGSDNHAITKENRSGITSRTWLTISVAGAARTDD
jgi:hypothetical protein